MFIFYLLLTVPCIVTAKMRQTETEKRKYEDQLRTKDLDLLGKQSAAARIATIHSNLLKGRSIEEDRIKEAKWECDQLKEKTKRAEEEIKLKQAIVESQTKDMECAKEFYSEVNGLIVSIESQNKKVDAQNNNLERKAKKYQLEIEKCLHSCLQNPTELRNTLNRLYNSSQLASHSEKSDESTSVEVRNDITIITLQLKTELDELKSVEALLIKQNKEERQLQIQRNTRILHNNMTRERTENNTKRQSDAAVTYNTKRIQALRGAL